MKPGWWMSCISTTNVVPARSLHRTSRIDSLAPSARGSCSLGRYSSETMVCASRRSSRSFKRRRRMSGCVAKMRRKTKSFFRSAKAMPHLAPGSTGAQAGRGRARVQRRGAAPRYEARGTAGATNSVPQLPPDAVVIVDNLSAHHSEDARDALEAHDLAVVDDPDDVDDEEIADALK